MRASRESLPVTMETDEATIQEGEWGDMHVSFEMYKKRWDITPFFKGLPHDRDQCPHWGYVFKGEYRVTYPNGMEEVFKAGDVYYIEPGHGTVVEAGTEIVEFSPRELLRKTMETISRNMESMAKIK